MTSPDQFISNLFKESWQKKAKKTAAAGRRYLNYQKDRLSEDQVTAINQLILDLKKERKGGSPERAEVLSQELEVMCGNALPHYTPETEMQFQVVDIFVTIVVIFAIRTFIFQPYRIPTGSMQPTLNGVKVEPLARAEWPGAFSRVLQYPLNGKAYVDCKVKDDDVLVGVRDKMFLVFLNQTELKFKSGKKKTINVPLSQALEAGLFDYIRNNQVFAVNPGGLLDNIVVPVKKGDVLFSGAFEAGDTIVVNKMEYHFRKPKLGEVFVFDTLGISNLKEFTGDQAGGSNYIKRLSGLPGQRVEIQSPELFVDDQRAEGLGFERVMRREPPYNPTGYFGNQRQLYIDGNKIPRLLRNTDGSPKLEDSRRQVFKLNKGEDVNLHEYLALGDNTENSLDSRAWGPVYQHNVVGPAGIAIWPFTNGHFGFIK